MTWIGWDRLLENNQDKFSVARPILSVRFESALVFAFQLHARQVRKGGQIPYIAHLLAVAALVLEDGGDEDQAIAALLHDAVEDQGGKQTLQLIQERYGENVAQIVAGCTDADHIPKPPWRQRKETYLEHLIRATAEVRRVSLADKLHNARSLSQDLRRDGEAVWGRFKGGKQGTLWYYHSLVDIFGQFEHSQMYLEFKKAVEEINFFSRPNSGLPSHVY